MNHNLLSTISIMNFNNMGFVRSLSKKAYSPSTDFIFNNFKPSRSYSDFIDYKTKNQVNDFLNRFDESSNALSDTSNQLKRLYLNAHKQKTAHVDNNALTAIAQNNAKIQDYKLSINQLATTQIDNSSTYNKEGKDLSAFGNINLTLKQNGQEVDINVHTETHQTNQDILKATAAAINDSTANVKATVLTDNDNNSLLSIESKDTGQPSSFNISGGFNEFIKLHTLSSAKNASYTLDGINHISASNTISLDKGNLQVTFNHETSDTKNISVSLDTKPLINQLTSLAKNLQVTATFLKDFNRKSGMVSKYDRRFNYLLNSNKTVLNNLGISKGTLENIHFDKEQFVQKFEATGDSLLKELNTSGGFIDQLDKFSNDLKNQSIQTLIPRGSNNTLPKFNNDDFISYLSFSNNFNINAFFPTGNILDFNL